MRIGTRGSALAVVQAEWVAARLPGAELITITTSGDRGDRISDKSRWVSELERALLDGRIDVAVHSAKDVPAELAEGTVLASIPPREDPADALCGFESLEAVPAGARIGTSSLRRAAQLRALRPDLGVVELRGNVDTRLRKLAEHEVDALVLAMAGLRRLERSSAAGARLDQLVPAAGQGALALQTVSGSAAHEATQALSDPEATACVTAERDLTRALGASCQTAVGAHACPHGSEPGQLELTAWVGLPDGSEWISDSFTAAPDRVGAEVAERMSAAGARELLRRAERESTAR